MTTPDQQSQHSKPVRLANAAYRAALADKWPAARAAVIRISNECGGAGITTALITWCDLYVDHAADGPAIINSPDGPRFWEVDSGALDGEGSPEVPAHIRWAGDLMAAYGRRDEPRFWDLIDAMPGDEAEVGLRVLAVLRGAADATNLLPRGYLRMGQGAA